MGKWLAVAGVGLVAVLVVLWRQLEGSTATATAATPSGETQIVAAAPSPMLTSVKPPSNLATAPIVSGDGVSKKMEVESDEFFYKFQEVVPAVLTRQAAACYEGIAKPLHRNQKLTLKFKMKIKDGDVTVNDVTIKTNTLENPGLETCFIQAVQRASWHDDSLPDWESSDELVLRPERGMKKYMRANIEYVGAEAPKD